MAKPAEPPAGTRDFLAADARRRERAFAAVRDVFERYGFDPLITPAFERIEVLTGKYGDEGDKLIFKILRRGEHEATGEADMALRYDLTVPLARVVAKYRSQLPNPYKRYALGPVWRADRPGRGRFREFTQCDIDIIGSTSPLADAEIVWAVHDGLHALGVRDFQFQVNSRSALFGLLEAYQVSPEISGSVLIALDKLDKLAPEVVARELLERGLDGATADALTTDLSAKESTHLHARLESTELGRAGLAEISRMLELTKGLGQDRVRLNPQIVRGLDYYTGLIWEVTAPGHTGSIASGGRYDGLVATLGGPDTPACGGSIGLERILSSMDTESEVTAGALDVAITVLDESTAATLTELAGSLRREGLRVGVYLGPQRKLARQMKWASETSARFTLLFGPQEQANNVITVRDMHSGEQHPIAIDAATASIAALVGP